MIPRDRLALLLSGLLAAVPALASSVPAAPEDGGPRNWQVSKAASAVHLREQPSRTSRSLARLVPGTILDNLGCRRAGNEIWCDVQRLGGGSRGYVAAEFLKPAVSPDGSVAVGTDDSALHAGQGKFDATGGVPCALRAGQPTTQCKFGVARAGGGYATVIMTKPTPARPTATAGSRPARSPTST